MRKESLLTYVSLVAIILVGAAFRLVDLSEPGFVVDEIGFTTDGEGFILRGDFEAHYDHPPLGKYFLGASALALGLTEFAARLPVAISSILTMFVTFLIARKLYDEKVGLFAAGLVSLSVYEIAYSRVALLDGVLALFYSITFFVFTGSSDRQKNWLYGVPIGLAVATKLSGLYLYLVVLAYLFICEGLLRYRGGKLALKIGRNNIIALGASILSIFLVWPSALQLSPFETRFSEEVPLFFKTFYFDWQYLRQGLTTFFMGEISNNPPPWFFLVFLFSKLSIPYLLLSALGMILAVNRRRKSDILLLLWFFIPLIMFSFQSVKQLRYLVPILPPLSILAGAGITDLYRRSRRVMRKVFATSLIVLLSWQILILLSTHPDYLLYYNEAVGGPSRATAIFMVGQGEGLREAAKYLESRANRGDTVLSSWHQDILEHYSNLHYQQMPKTLGELSTYNAKWAVVYLTQVQRKLPSGEVIEFFETKQPEHTISVRGVPLVKVYRLGDE